MFESIMKLIKKITKKEDQTLKSKDAAKERLHLVLMQDRANVSADFLDLMKQEIIEVIKKYIDIDEAAMDVRLTNKENGDGTNGAPALYANIPILNIKDETRQNAKVNSSKNEKNMQEVDEKQENKKQENQPKESESQINASKEEVLPDTEKGENEINNRKDIPKEQKSEKDEGSKKNQNKKKNNGKKQDVVKK